MPWQLACGEFCLTTAPIERIAPENRKKLRKKPELHHDHGVTLLASGLHEPPLLTSQPPMPILRRPDMNPAAPRPLERQRSRSRTPPPRGVSWVDGRRDDDTRHAGLVVGSARVVGDKGSRKSVAPVADACDGCQRVAGGLELEVLQTWDLWNSGLRQKTPAFLCGACRGSRVTHGSVFLRNLDTSGARFVAIGPLQLRGPA